MTDDRRQESPPAAPTPAEPAAVPSPAEPLSAGHTVEPVDPAGPLDPVAGFPDLFDPDGPVDGRVPPAEQSGLASTIEALLFLSSDPVGVDELAVACSTGPDEVVAALDELRVVFAPGRRGLLLRQIGGGFVLSSAPETEPAARRLLTAPRTPPLTPAQAETLSIVAYLQPVSRPEITRIRGVAADSACATLVERGMIEEAGRSQFGAVLYRTTGLFLKLFGLDGLADLPDPSAWDPTPEETATLRDRLLMAGDARGGNDPISGDDPDLRPVFDPGGSGGGGGVAREDETAGGGEDDGRGVDADADPGGADAGAADGAGMGAGDERPDGGS